MKEPYLPKNYFRKKSYSTPQSSLRMLVIVKISSLEVYGISDEDDDEEIHLIILFSFFPGT